MSGCTKKKDVSGCIWTGLFKQFLLYSNVFNEDCKHWWGYRTSPDAAHVICEKGCHTFFDFIMVSNTFFPISHFDLWQWRNIWSAAELIALYPRHCLGLMSVHLYYFSKLVGKLYSPCSNIIACPQLQKHIIYLLVSFTNSTNKWEEQTQL